MKNQLLKSSKRTAKIITASILTSAVALSTPIIGNSHPFSAYAAENIGENDIDIQQAVVLVKSRISVPEECTQFDSSSTRYESGTEYILRWETPSSYAGNRIICSAEINSKGDITHYNKRVSYTDSYDYGKHFSLIGQEEAVNTAKEWLFKANPAWQGDFPDDAVTYNDNNLSDDCVYVEFKRIKNGLSFCDDYVGMALDKNTGEVLRMNSSYTYAEEDKIPSPDTAVSTDAITEKFFEASPMELKYIDVHGKGILVYSPKSPYLQLNAQNGDKFNNFRYGMSEVADDEIAEDTTASGSSSSSKDNGSLTEEELKSINEVNSLLSADELKNIAEGIKDIGIENAEFLSVSYSLQHRETETSEDAIKNDSTAPKYIASLIYTLKSVSDDNYYRQLRITLNAKTGELESLYCDFDYAADYGSADSGMTYTEAAAKAEEFLKNYSGGIAAEVKTDNGSERAGGNGSLFYINFDRFANNVIFPDNGVYITVNKHTGEIVSYYKSWSDNIIFESTDGISDATAAQAALAEKSEFNLSYAKLQGESKITPIIGLKYKLVSYCGYGSYMINAKSLKLINSSGEDVTQTDNYGIPSDIDGHYAEDKIVKLIESGALITDGNEFRPDDDITLEEFSDMLQNIFYRTTPLKLFGIYDSSQEGNRRNEAAIREYAAQAFAYSAGYENTARLKNVFTTGFTDEAEINPELIGSVAVCKGLGVMNGDENNCFNPNAPLKRGDAAIMLYNYLSR